MAKNVSYYKQYISLCHLNLKFKSLILAKNNGN